MLPNFKNINLLKIYLIIANVILVFFLIFLFNLGLLPLKFTGDFWFFSFLVLAFALYRPGWAFLFFIGTVAIESVTLAPQGLGFNIRPYQLLGGAALSSLIVRFATGRLSFSLAKMQWADYFLGAMVLGGALSAVNAYDNLFSVKLVIISGSLFILYLLCRNYLQEEKDLNKVIPFFLSSAVIIVLYGLWQNIRFIQELSSFETMPGRSNSTFMEPDWLGIYLIILIALIYSLIYYFSNASKNNLPAVSNFKLSIFNLILFIFLTLVYILLILTVSRSAWLGTFFVTLLFLFIVLTEIKLNFKAWRWKVFLRHGIGIIISLITSIGVIYIFSLTSFQLFNRAQSVVSGFQKITLACPANIDVVYPKEIRDLSEVTKYGCRHINLENIEEEEKNDKLIVEVMRPDPNVNIRKTIYQKSWNAIKEHPVLGIGWGSIGKILGNDERESSLNSSNIFLEVWLGSGILGLLAFVGFWILIVARAGVNFFSEDGIRKYIGLFVILGSMGLIVANLFNAGIFLGVIYVFFAVAMI